MISKDNVINEVCLMMYNDVLRLHYK